MVTASIPPPSSPSSIAISQAIHKISLPLRSRASFTGGPRAPDLRDEINKGQIKYHMADMSMAPG